APIAGTVGRRNAEVGMQVSSNTHLFTIGDLRNLRIEVVLTGEMLNEVTVGQRVRIYAGSEANRNIIKAKLSRISLCRTNITRSTEAESDVTNDSSGLRLGMFIPVDILCGESRQATLLPTSAVYANPNTRETGVFIATSLGAEIDPVEQLDSD